MEELEGETDEDSMEAYTVSAMEARLLASRSTCASWKEPGIVVVVVGGAAFELTVPALKAMVSAMEARSLVSTLMGANFYYSRGRGGSGVGSHCGSNRGLGSGKQVIIICYFATWFVTQIKGDNQ